jgi:hypothetical protein
VSKKKNVSFDGGPVGFKRPPVEHQFKKGQKPPGSGRKKGSKNSATIMTEIMESFVARTRDGKKERVSVRKALLMNAAAKALTGTVRDVERMFELENRLAPRHPDPIRFKLIPGDDW